MTHLFQFSSEDYRDPLEIDDIPELNEEWLTREKIDNRRRTPPEPRVCLRGPDEPRTDVEQGNVQNEDMDGNGIKNFDVRDDNEVSEESDSGEETLAPEGVRRNLVQTLRGINRRYHNEDFVNLSAAERQKYVTDTLNLAYLTMLDNDNFEMFDNHLLIIRQQMQRKTDECGMTQHWHPLYLVTKPSAEDNPTLQQVLASPERRGWEEAMQVELDALEKMKVHIGVPRSAAKSKPILNSTWAFKRKRFPDGFPNILTHSSMECRSYTSCIGSNVELNEQTSGLYKCFCSGQCGYRCIRRNASDVCQG